jgi:hypothetical protein
MVGAAEQLERAFASVGFDDPPSRARQVMLLSNWAIGCAGRQGAAALLLAEAAGAARAFRAARERSSDAAEAALPWLAHEALCRVAVDQMAGRRDEESTPARMQDCG